ncbi:hypothetical protein BDZ94DRAFT_900411 [Collybia nuda]|uniref:DUF6534 domain-containing protein n=1 Tax=Collybia nuda TaxID=64659 RepID=A0A9P6CP85_9AGAR|nr:hypothetical protein BDZ94DRAFT_900411 [Collybia nuda]
MDNEILEKGAGPLLVAYLASWGFQGVLCVQVYQYYRAFPNDRPFLKILVYGVFTLEVVQTILVARDAFDTFVVGFADLTTLSNIRLLWLSFPVLGGIVGSMCRLFLIYRLHILSKSWVSTLSATILAVVTEVAAILTGVEFSTAGSFISTYGQRKTYIVIGLWGGSGAACDAFITASMVYYLLHQKAKFKRTRARIAFLIVTIVETGALTAAISTLNFLLFICIKWSSYFIIPLMIVAKLYSNTMLLALNNRISIVGGRNEHINPDYSLNMHDPSQREFHHDPEGKSTRRGNIEVQENSTSIDQLGFSCDQNSEIARPTNITIKAGSGVVVY